MQQWGTVEQLPEVLRLVALAPPPFHPPTGVSMSIHPVNLLIAVLISALLSYGLASMESNSLAGTVAIGSLIFLSVTLGTAIGFSAASPRTTVNVRALAGATFVLGLAVQLVFAFGWFSQTVYVVTTGTLFLIFILAANALHDVRH
jgi:hypothetical protein